MKPSFRITPRAFDDLKNIARYTCQQWGAEQRDRYLGALDSRFGWLAEHPNSGKASSRHPGGLLLLSARLAPDLLSRASRRDRHHRRAEQANGCVALLRRLFVDLALRFSTGRRVLQPDLPGRIRTVLVGPFRTVPYRRYGTVRPVRLDGGAPSSAPQSWTMAVTARPPCAFRHGRTPRIITLARVDGQAAHTSPTANCTLRPQREKPATAIFSESEKRKLTKRGRFRPADAVTTQRQAQWSRDVHRPHDNDDGHPARPDCPNRAPHLPQHFVDRSHKPSVDIALGVVARDVHGDRNGFRGWRGPVSARNAPLAAPSARPLFG